MVFYLLSSLFIVSFFFFIVDFPRFYSVFLCVIIGTAENKYLKVPHNRDDIVLEFKMQHILRLHCCRWNA